eukprot:154168-Rhodomonas_salina.2
MTQYLLEPSKLADALVQRIQEKINLVQKDAFKDFLRTYISSQSTIELVGQDHVTKSLAMLDEGKALDAVANLAPAGEAGATEFVQNLGVLHTMIASGVASKEEAELWLRRYDFFDAQKPGLDASKNERMKLILAMLDEHLKRDNPKTLEKTVNAVHGSLEDVVLKKSLIANGIELHDDA